LNLGVGRQDIAAERMKMDTSHIASLGRQPKALLKKLQALSLGYELVLPGDIDPNKPKSNNTILFALYRMGYRGRVR